MTLTDWTALTALIISAAALALEVRRWFESKVRLRLTAMSDMITVPDDDGRSKFSITVSNVGHMPVEVRIMVATSFRSIFHRWLSIQENSFVIPLSMVSPVPFKLETGTSWKGIAYYTDEVRDLRQRGKLFAGVATSNRGRPYLTRILKKEVSS